MVPFYKPNIDVESIDTSVIEALKTGQVTNWGSKTVEFENKLSSYLNREVVLLASGTHALTFGLLGMADTGMIPKTGARILVPSFTFYASVTAIIWANMIPVFCDIHPDTFTIDITKATGPYDAIMPVNVFGVQHDCSPLKSNTNKPIIGDLSHGFGGSKFGIENGKVEDVACFSASITKPMQSIEGGILAADHNIVKYVRKFRNWGNPGKQYDCDVVGQWSKITEINSIIGLSSLENINKSVSRKNDIGRKYKEALGDSVQYQIVPENTLSTYKDFSVLFKDKETRDRISEILDDNKIGNKKYFYPPVHLLSCFGDTYKNLDLPVTCSISDRVLCLPMFDLIEDSDIKLISTIILENIK